MWEHVEPGLTLEVRGPQQLLHGLIGSFRQNIGLRVIRRNEVLAYVELVAQFCPELQRSFLCPGRIRYSVVSREV